MIDPTFCSIGMMGIMDLFFSYDGNDLSNYSNDEHDKIKMAMMQQQQRQWWQGRRRRMNRRMSWQQQDLQSGIKEEE